MSIVDIMKVTAKKVAEITNLAKTMNCVILMKKFVELDVEEMNSVSLMNIVTSLRTHALKGVETIIHVKIMNIVIVSMTGYVNWVAASGQEIAKRGNSAVLTIISVRKAVNMIYIVNPIKYVI